MATKNSGPRSTGSATIAFGMVSVPIKVYTAVTPQKVEFNQLHDACSSRLKQQYVCSNEDCNGAVVSKENTIKGYEVSKGRYITFTAEELKSLEEVANQTIDICEFVPLNQVDPVHFEKSHILSPDKGGAKAYALLTEAMARSGRVAIARYAARGKQYLVALRVVKNSGGQSAIMMHQLYFSDEIRDIADISIDQAKVDPAQVELAMKLVHQISTDKFVPEMYTDAVKERIMAAIGAKEAGDLFEAPPQKAAEEPIDLMAALKASLAS
jgi:DNA end-binding protein Ku